MKCFLLSHIEFLGTYLINSFSGPKSFGEFEKCSPGPFFKITEEFSGAKNILQIRVPSTGDRCSYKLVQSVSQSKMFDRY